MFPWKKGTGEDAAPPKSQSVESKPLMEKNTLCLDAEDSEIFLALADDKSPPNAVLEEAARRLRESDSH